MGEEATQSSASRLNPEKTASTVFPKSLKAASKILKSITSLNSKKSQSTNLPSGSQSAQSVQKSISIAVSGKSQSSRISESKSSSKFASNISINNKRTESKLTTKEIEDKNTADQREIQTTVSIEDFKTGKTFSNRKRQTRFMRKYPELFRDDVSINPSYTGLRKLPYNVVCRQRFHRNKLKINRQLDREIENITMTQTLALDGVRVGRIFSVGFPPAATVVQDFASPSERLRLNRMLDER